MRAAPWSLPALALWGCAAPGATSGDQARSSLADELVGYDQGETRDCLPSALDNVSPRIVDDRTIVYQQTRSVKWVSSLPAACPGLRPTSMLVIQRTGSRTCRLDRFNAVGPGTANIAGPICTFGAFVRYRKPS